MTIEEGFKFIISMGVIVPEGPIKESLIANQANKVAYPASGP